MTDIMKLLNKSYRNNIEKMGRRMQSDSEKEITLIIANQNYSGWSMRAWLALKKSGVSFSLVCLPLNTKKFQEEVSTWSPTGRLPVLIHGESVIWDSLAIIEYTNEAFGNNSLWPEHLSIKGHARSVAAEVHSGFMPLRRTLPFNCRAKDRSIVLSEDLQKDLARVESVISDCINKSGGPWLFGKFSAADIMYIPLILRLQTYNINLKEDTRRYASVVNTDPDVLIWCSAAALEQETLESEEIGLVHHQ